jgi:hypothetical protein
MLASLAFVAQLLLVVREAGEVAQEKSCVVINSLEVLGSTLAANDVVVAAFTTAELDQADPLVCSEKLRAQFPDLKFGLASGVRSREFAPVIPVIHEDPTVIMFVDYGASRIVLRSKLLKEAASKGTPEEANELVAEFVQNTLDERRGVRKPNLTGDKIDPPVYQDEHQAYVDFLFNKTHAFLDRTEDWHMLVFADYTSAGTKWLNDVLEAVQPQLRGEVLMLRMNQEDSENVMQLLNVKDHMLPQPVMLRVADRQYEQMNEETITENGLVVFAEAFITKSEEKQARELAAEEGGSEGDEQGVGEQMQKLDLAGESAPSDLLALCEQRFSSVSGELQELKGGWHRGRQQLLEQTQQQQVQLQGQLEEQFLQKCDARLEEQKLALAKGPVKGQKLAKSISVTCKENTQCQMEVREQGVELRKLRDEAKTKDNTIKQLEKELKAAKAAQPAEATGQAVTTCNCDAERQAIIKKCKARLTEESELREETEQEAYEELRACTDVKDELRKKLLEGESCTEVNGDDISQELLKIQTQLTSMAKRAKNQAITLETSVKDGQTAVAKSVAEKLEKGTSVVAAANSVAEKLDIAIKQLQDSPSTAFRGEDSPRGTSTFVGGIFTGLMQALCTVLLGAAILAYLVRKGRLAGVFDKPKSAEDMVWDKAMGGKGAGGDALVAVVRTEMTTLRTSVSTQLQTLTEEKTSATEFSTVKDELKIARADARALKKLNDAHEQETINLNKDKLRLEAEQRKGTAAVTQKAVETAVQASLGNFAKMQQDQGDQLRQLRKQLDTQPSSDLLMQNAISPLLEAHQEHCEALEAIRSAQKNEPGMQSVVAPLQKALDNVSKVISKQGSSLQSLQKEVAKNADSASIKKTSNGGGGQIDNKDFKDAIQSVLDSQEDSIIALRAVQAESTAIRHNTNANTATLRSLQLDMSRAQRDAQRAQRDAPEGRSSSSSSRTANGPGPKGSGFSSSRNTDSSTVSRHGGKSVKRYDAKDIANLRPSNTDKPDSVLSLEKKYEPGAWAQGDGKTIFEAAGAKGDAAPEKKSEKGRKKSTGSSTPPGSPASSSRTASGAGSAMLLTLQRQTGNKTGGSKKGSSKGDLNWRESNDQEKSKDKKDGKK